MRTKVLLIFAKLGNNLQYHPHFWNQLQIQGSWRQPLLTRNTTFRFPRLHSISIFCQKDSLKAFMFTVTVHFSVKIQIKIIQKKRWKVTRAPGSSDDPLLLVSETRLTFPAMMFNSTHRTLPARVAHWSLNVQSLCWGSVL